jgi:hypothetical protein
MKNTKTKGQNKASPACDPEAQRGISSGERDTLQKTITELSGKPT